jgi:hypothetical protein
MSTEADEHRPVLSRPMVARDREETHRAATPLELLFDLVFVVAVAQAASALHHALAEDRIGAGLTGYAMVFFAIWWAWMNFTWFASAYDTDDVPYRLAVFVQMSGALVLAAGVPKALEHRDFAVATLGYVIMRAAAVPQWLRAARADPPRRSACLRFAAGITLVQAGWVARLALPGGWARGGVRPPGGGGAAGADRRRAGHPHALAPAAHRRTLRVVHTDRAGGVDPRRECRGPVRPGHRHRVRASGHDGRRRVADPCTCGRTTPACCTRRSSPWRRWSCSARRSPDSPSWSPAWSWR